MARYNNVTTNFSGGLITDNLVGRTDLARTANSCRKFDNFFPTLQGPATFRQGFEVHSWRTTDTDLDVRQVELTLATTNKYRVIFSSNEINVYDSTGTLKTSSPVASPYSTSELEDLRFSTETDVLHITHPSHRPRTFTAALVFVQNTLIDEDSKTILDEDGLICKTNVAVTGDTSWTLAEIETTVEPFLEKDVSGTRLSVYKGEEIAKVVSTANDFTAIVTDYNSGGFAHDWYVEYDVSGTKVIGKVIATSSNYSEVVAPTATTVYVDAVDFVTTIEDKSAKLYLLDNNETDTDDDDILIKDGVPDTKIHLRSDVAVFNIDQANSFVRVGTDVQSSDIIIGYGRSTNRWVKLKEYLGTSAHPVEFLRGTAITTAGDSDFYEFSSVYKSYGNGTFDVRDAANTVTAKVVEAGQRSFTWNGGDFHSVSSTDADSVVGNLSTTKSFDVYEVDETVRIETGYNLVIPTGTTTVTEIANDVTVVATDANFFVDGQTVGRYIKGDMPNGVAYMKILARDSAQQVRALLKTPVPRQRTTGDYENSGVFESFSMGAWYDGNYPRTVAKFERRRIYGGTYTDPNFLFFSAIDDETTFAPTQADGTVLDTDGITYPLGNVNASVRWILSARELVIGTTRGIFRVIGNQYEAVISPKTIRIELVDDTNCKGEAFTLGTSVFFPNESNTMLMEYKYDQAIQSSNANDISKFIYPTFITDKIKRIAIQENPHYRIWVLTESGLLYCLTYHRLEDYYAWSKQITYDRSGVQVPVRDIVVIKEGSSNDLDLVVTAVNRQGATLHYEVLSDEANTGVDKVMLDGAESGSIPLNGSTYDGSTGELLIPVTNTSLYSTGSYVDVVLDGVYYGQKQVGSNTVRVSIPTSSHIAKYQIGQKYTGLLNPMYPTWNGTNKPAYGSDEIRAISSRLYVIDSSTFKVGVDGTYDTVTLDGHITTTEKNADVTKVQGSFTGFDRERPMAGSYFGVDKTPQIKQDQPSELTVVSLITKTDLN